MSIKVLSSEYVASIGATSQLPPELAGEVVFAGRSNSGKSSLLNAFCGRKGLARVGATPGKTRTINLYDLHFRAGENTDEQVTLVDVPGYGFAKRSKSEIGAWHELLSDYFDDRKLIRFVVLVVDCRRNCEEEERWFLQKIERGKLIIAATKTDKLKKNEQRLVQAKMAKEFKIKPTQVFPLSMVPKIVGVEPLRNYILGY